MTRAYIGLLLLAAGCGQVLGIEDAHVDPTFTTSGDAFEPAPSCATYCEQMASSCVEENAQYFDVTQCLATCGRLPAGVLDDATGNTLSCRLASADAAASASGEELATLCREAGPGGDGACGTTCESYCGLMLAACAPENTSFSYPDSEACLAECETLPQVAYVYADEVFSGDSVQCRTFYAAFAAEGSSEDCERARGLSVCVEAPAE